MNKNLVYLGNYDQPENDPNRMFNFHDGGISEEGKNDDSADSGSGLLSMWGRRLGTW